MATLNQDQQQAVQALEGKVLVLAGAGSGKTRVIIERIAHLLNEKNVPSHAILGLTFTNKAANEMRKRIAKFTGSNTENLTLCTFHSFCMQILRAEIHHLGYTREFSLYDERDVKRLIKQLTADLLKHSGDLPSLEKTFAALQKKRNNQLKEDKGWHYQFVCQLHEHLSLSMRAYNALDFDSLISLTVQLFTQFPQILEKYSKQYRYIMIDEYQDTNQIQYTLAKQLSSTHNNLCVVGDDDQAIYSWRGAQVQHILNFPYDTIIRLQQNYRSTPTILNAANAVIENNKIRHQKSLFSTKNVTHPIEVFHAPTDKEEALGVIKRILHLKSTQGLSFGDIAILYRSNQLAKAFEPILLNTLWKCQGSYVRGIPYHIYGGTELYARCEIKDIFAYLRFLSNPKDTEALLRIINVPRRGISEKTLDALTQKSRLQQQPLWDLLNTIDQQKELVDALSSQGKSGIHLFLKQIQEGKALFSTRPLHVALNAFIDLIDYKKAIASEVKSEKMRQFKWDNVQECVEMLRLYEKEQGKNAQLHHFVTQLQLNPSQPHKNKQQSGCLNLMTFHSAKGLEFPACFLVGLEDHILPHEKSVNEGGIEEERRLFYVALTRAEQFLTLSMSNKRSRQGREEKSAPSRFLFEIPPSELKATAWNTI